MVDDSSLWEKIKQTVTPMDRGDVLPDFDGKKMPQKTNIARRKTKASPVTASSKTLPSKPKTVLPALNIDRSTWRQIDKGKLSVDGKLDLHGLTVAQAHQRFDAYIKESVAQDKKCVIVVTGKGCSVKGTGTIRRELPHWAEHPKVARYIHALSEPSQNKGRYVIILRRRHKIA